MIRVVNRFVEFGLRLFGSIFLAVTMCILAALFFFVVGLVAPWSEDFQRGMRRGRDES